MVLLSIFLLAGLDEAINPKSRQTIAKRVKLGLSNDEINRLTRPINFDAGQTGLGLRKTRVRKRRSITF